MSWSPNDLVSDRDLVSYEANILTQYGQVDWQLRRQKALEDWLFPILMANGFVPHRLRTRYTPDQVWAFTGGVYTDKTDAAKDTTTDDINAATVFATPSTDALYVGSTQPFRGLSIRMLDDVSSVTGTLSVTAWCDVWQSLAETVDGTMRVSGKTLSGGGAITWDLPEDWTERAINSSSRLFWVRLKASAVPTGAKFTQVGCIRRSLLCAPAAYRTLMLIFREAPTTQGDGPWREKAEWYEQQSDAAIQRVLGQIGGEFDTIAVDDIVDETEAVQTAAEVSGGGWTLERA